MAPSLPTRRLSDLPPISGAAQAASGSAARASAATTSAVAPPMAIATAAPSEIFFFIASILQANIFDPQLEQVGDAAGEGERRVVFPRLDRVDRLARHLEPLGEIALAPVAPGAQALVSGLHDRRLPCQLCRSR